MNRNRCEQTNVRINVNGGHVGLQHNSAIRVTHTHTHTHSKHEPLVALLRFPDLRSRGRNANFPLSQSSKVLLPRERGTRNSSKSHLYDKPVNMITNLSVCATFLIPYIRPTTNDLWKDVKITQRKIENRGNSYCCM